MVLIVFFIWTSDIWAQCAMCKAQLASGEGEVGNGINNGILFLMIIPYVLLLTLVVVFFNKRLKTAVKGFLNT